MELMKKYKFPIIFAIVIELIINLGYLIESKLRKTKESNTNLAQTELNDDVFNQMNNNSKIKYNNFQKVIIQII